MTPREVAERRLDAQRISATSFERPSDVVAWLGAVQAQDYLGALWSVGLRLVDAREDDVERALAERTIVRTWPLRGTLHFVSPADARWMIELLSTRIVARAESRFRALGLDTATFARARRALGKALQGGKALSRAAVYAVLERARVSTAGQRGIHILWRLAHEPFLCFGPRAAKQHTFVLFDEWLPRASSLAEDDALERLARRYFGAHGPATVADFAWWSGLTLRGARRAIGLAGKRLTEVEVEGRAHWFDEAAASSAAPRARAHLLPSFDELLVGYADRTATLRAEDARRVNTGGGILLPIVVIDGRAAATWKRTLAHGKVSISWLPFAPLTKTKLAEMARACRRYAAFLGLEAHLPG